MICSTHYISSFVKLSGIHAATSQCSIEPLIQLACSLEKYLVKIECAVDLTGMKAGLHEARMTKTAVCVFETTQHQNNSTDGKWNGTP